MDRIPVECTKCGAPMGAMVLRNNQVRLDTGEWLIADGLRYCHCCGQAFHFKPPMATWEDLVMRYARRNGNGIGHQQDLQERSNPNVRAAGALRG